MRGCTKKSLTCAAARAPAYSLARLGLATNVGLSLALGCAPPESNGTPLPELPEGAELVLRVDDLEVYKAFDGPVCGGTLRRIEEHTRALATLFDAEPPAARLVLYSETEAIDAVCSTTEAVWGCAPWWGANALPASAAHELVHIFVAHATNHVTARPAIQEGLAGALEGEPSILDGEGTPADITALLAIRSPHDLPRFTPTHFFAWAVDRHGIQAVLDAHVATSGFDNDDDILLALADSLGYESPQELQADYEGTHALEYPRLPNTVPRFDAEQLDVGVMFSSWCESSFAEGPSLSEVTTVARLAIPEAGEYEVSYEPIPFASFNPVFQSTEPVFEAVPFDTEANRCAVETPVPHVVFYGAGDYEFLVNHAPNVGYQAMLSARRIGDALCTN